VDELAPEPVAPDHVAEPPALDLAAGCLGDGAGADQEHAGRPVAPLLVHAADDLADQAVMDVGSGGWDREGRPSEVRLDRLLVLAPGALRREGAALDRSVFEQVVAAARAFHDLG